MVNRINPVMLAEEFARRNIVPDYDCMYQETPNGQIRADIIGLINLIHETEDAKAWIEDGHYLNSKKVGVKSASKILECGKGYIFGITTTFQVNREDRAKEVATHLERVFINYPPKKPIDKEEFRMGMEDAWTLMKLLGLVHNYEKIKGDRVKIYECLFNG